MTPERFYTALLTLYPGAFRDAYGDDMLAAFSEMRRSNRRPALAFWWFALSDLARSMCRQQLDACRTGTRRFVLRWLAVCALGIIGTGLVASLVTRGLAYFYHPYLEGLQVSPWGYGALLGAGLGIAQSVALRHGLRTSLVWVLASAASASFGLHLAAGLAVAAGPVGCGIAIGAIVGGCQWTIARTRRGRPIWPVLASGISVAAAVVLFDGLIQRALGGMNPLSADLSSHALTGAQYGDAINVLVRGLQQPRDWADVAFESAAMVISGLTIGALTARPLLTGRHADQTIR